MNITLVAQIDYKRMEGIVKTPTPRDHVIHSPPQTAGSYYARIPTWPQGGSYVEQFDGEVRERSQELKDTRSRGEHSGGTGIPWWLIVAGYVIASIVLLNVSVVALTVLQVVFVIWVVRKLSLNK